MTAERRQLAASPANSYPRREVTDLIAAAAAAAAGALSTDTARRCSSVRPSVCPFFCSHEGRLVVPESCACGASVSQGGWRRAGVKRTGLFAAEVCGYAAAEAAAAASSPLPPVSAAAQ